MKKTILLLFVLGTMSFSSKNDLPIKQAYLKKGYTVALSQSYFKEMINATSTGDRKYFAKLLKDSKIVTLQKDTKVSVVSSSAFNGKVVARIFGSDSKVWTVYEALKYK